jgi:penicillin-binding protein 2
MVGFFANGGKIFEPHVVKSINGVGDFPTKILNENIIDESSYDTIREGMRLALIPGGTAYPFFDFSQKHGGVRVAGKTGTSEYIDSNGKEKTHAWFSVFGPYDTPAQISLTVFLEGGGAGSSDAAPVARELMDFWFRDSL